jgi:signal transduction histidine kinase
VPYDPDEESVFRAGQVVPAGVYARSQGLRPSALDDLGLGPALKSAAARWGSALGATVDVRVDGTPPRPGSPLGNVLYRVAEEAVANAVQHGRAGYVAVTLRARPGWVELEVADDGDGFASGALDPAKALGLLGMRERLALVGGRLEVTSTPGEGTVVVARAPGAPDAEAMDRGHGPAA